MDSRLAAEGIAAKISSGAEASALGMLMSSSIFSNMPQNLENGSCVSAPGPGRRKLSSGGSELELLEYSSRGLLGLPNGAWGGGGGGGTESTGRREKGGTDVACTVYHVSLRSDAWIAQTRRRTEPRAVHHATTSCTQTNRGARSTSPHKRRCCIMSTRAAPRPRRTRHREGRRRT
jgi:hypothetical protein